MVTYVCLLRGINVSGRNPIKMGDLERFFLAMGHADVTTFIQSGNVVFKTRRREPVDLGAEIERRIALEFGIPVQVLLRTASDLGDVLKMNPFVRRRVEPATLHVTFLSQAPDPGLSRQLERQDTGADEFALVAREVYLHCPQGYGRTKLNNAFWERRLKVAATTRNWKTVSTLFDLAGG